MSIKWYAESDINKTAGKQQFCRYSWILINIKTILILRSRYVARKTDTFRRPFSNTLSVQFLKNDHESLKWQISFTDCLLQPSRATTTQVQASVASKLLLVCWHLPISVLTQVYPCFLLPVFSRRTNTITVSWCVFLSISDVLNGYILYS